MKLRIKGDTVRLRLTKGEVEALGKEGIIKESVHFSLQEDQQFHYVLSIVPDDKTVSIEFINNTINVKVPKETAKHWITTDEVGFEANVVGEGRCIHVLVEKDFQCLHRDNTEEPDNYANPLAK